MLEHMCFTEFAFQRIFLSEGVAVLPRLAYGNGRSRTVERARLSA
jgi:hypothetical protein